MGYRIEVRDKNLNRIGVIDTWIQLDMVIQFCDQGSWKLLIKAGTDQANLLQQGGGVAIYQEGVATPVLTGPIEDFQKYWTVEQHSGVGSLYVGGKTDNKLAYSRLAFPDPALSVAQQYSSSKDVRAVKKPVNVLMWEEVNKSLGPGAITNRRVAGVNTGTVPAGVGASKSDTLRYDVIGEKFSQWCADNKNGWRFIYNPNTKSIDLRVYQPRDLSKSVRFSPELGNLREYVWMLSAPKVTRVVVACQGEGKDRYIWQKIDSASESEWGIQIEQFVDRRDVPLKTGKTGNPQIVTTIEDNGWEDIGKNEDGNEWTQALTNAKAAYEAAEQANPGENHDVEYDAVVAAINAAKPTAVAYYLEVIDQAASDILKEGEKSGNFQIYPIDTEQIQFGRDYFVGDIVSIDIDGTTYSDVVREVNITVDDGGNAVTVSPKIGDQGSGDPLNLYKTVFEMREKLRKLETRK